MPAKKVELTPSNVKKYIDIHGKLRLPFEMTVSNYTTHLKSRMFDLHFMKNAQNNRTFAAFQKVRNDCIKKEVPQINPVNVNYFATNIFAEDFYSDVIYNVDLKAAYATVLLNDGFLTAETYKHIMQLPKMERLASVGMLAGKKNIFKIDADGKILEDNVIISPTSDYFFYCVQKTFDVMHEARGILQESFLFSWVDGIYFLDKENKSYSELMQFFELNKFPISFEVLKEFHVKNKKTFYACSYWKGDKKKFMNVPKQQNSIIKNIANYLLTREY
jgi:hypothetical protein